MDYNNANRRFLQYYRPVRDIQRRYPQLVGPALAAGAVYGFNSLRRRIGQFGKSLYGRAVVGAFHSLKKNNMAKGKRRTPPTPKSPRRVKVKTMQYAKKAKSVKGKGKSYSVKKTYRGGHQLLDAVAIPERRPATTGGAPNTGYVVAKKKVNKKKQSKFARLGFEYKIERSGSALKPESLYVGHNSIPRNWAATMLFGAIIKKLFQRVGCLPSDPTKNMPFVNSADTLQLVYKVRTTDGEITANATFLTMGGTSLGAAINWWSNWITTNQWPQELEFVALQFLPDTVGNASILKFQRINLRTSFVKINSQSIMTIQNTSVGLSANPSVESLDATSLRGFVYEGKGSGTIYAADGTTYTVPFYGDGYGVINADSTVANSLKEPPQAVFFADVKRYNNVLFSPGEIKRSVLRDYFTISVNKMVRHLVAHLTPQSGFFPFLLGKFKFMGLERMVDFPGEGDPISLNWDHQLNIGAYLIGGYEDITCPYVIDA